MATGATIHPAGMIVHGTVKDLVTRTARAILASTGDGRWIGVGDAYGARYRPESVISLGDVIYPGIHYTPGQQMGMTFDQLDSLPIGSIVMWGRSPWLRRKEDGMIHPGWQRLAAEADECCTAHLIGARLVWAPDQSLA